jgi:hypothetical protein
MRIVTILRLILHMRHIDRDTTLTLLRSLINVLERRERVPATRSANVFVIAAVNVVLPWSI